MTLCKSCGDKIRCPNCTTWMVYHKNKDKIICHYCGHNSGIPSKCRSCGEVGSYIQFGPGVERIFEELRAKIPEARIAIGSSDTMTSEKDMSALFEKIHNKEVNVIIGTQILAKGHHFPEITLVGVIDGDSGLHGADLRSAEKTYQMISQVAGRAGRAEKPGEILIQTFNANHSLYNSLQSSDQKSFIDSEMLFRQESGLPPFSKFASIIISGTNGKLAEEVAMQLSKSCPKSVRLFGPAPAPIFKLRGRERWRILLKVSKKFDLSTTIKLWISSQKIPKNVKIQIDIDPISFL